MHLTRRHTRRLAPLTAAGVICAAAVVVPPAAAAEGDTLEIDIIGINDFHGRIEANGQSAGAASLAGAVESFRAANPDTLFVSAGDNIGASTFTSFVADDVPTMDVLDLMGLDVSALGNHEFDRGRVDVDDRVEPAVDFPYLAANIYDKATGKPAYDEYWVTEVDGVSVGFVGAMTEDLPALVSPGGIATLDVRPMLPEVNRVAAQLSDGSAANGEADVVVLLVHEGPASSAIGASTDTSSFGKLVTGLSPDVHAVFSGHTHTSFAHQIPVGGWAAGLTRPVVQSGQYGEGLAHVTLTVDATSHELVGTTSEVVDLVTGTPAAPVYPAVPAVASVVAAAVTQANTLGAAPLGTVTGDLLRAKQSNGSENRGGESTLGNFVADVQLWATRDLGAEIAVMNPGGLRKDVLFASSGPSDPAGNVTFREAAEVQPFANTLVRLRMTGEQVVDVLEEQWQPTGASRPFLKLGVAGITYTYDPTAAAGERITEARVAGAPIDPARTYTVVTNSFLATGGDNFATFAEVAPADRADSGRIDLQAFVDYMAANSPVTPDLAQRAVGVQVPEAPGGRYAPGDTLDVTLSSLLFSAGEAQDDEVVLTIGGVEVGRAAIDPTIVDTTDEVGRATVEITLPAFVAGTVEVVATVPGTGTTVSFDVATEVPSSVIPVAPVRVETPAVVAPNAPVCVQVAGEYGVPVEAVGVMLNVATVRPTDVGHVVVYPDEPGAARRATGSTVNFEVGQDVANATLVPLPENGRVCYLTRGAPAAGIVLDVSGFILPGAGVELQAAKRLLDTRSASPVGEHVGPIVPRKVYDVQVAGVAGVPDDATSVIVNVAVSEVRANGHLRVFPDGENVPDTAVVNYAPGRDKANLTVVALPESGKISFMSDTFVGTRQNPVQVILDVVGWTTEEAEYTGLQPERLLDTREDEKLRAGEELTLEVASAIDAPANATAVVLNVTAIRPSSVGHLRVYPTTDGDVPDIASINYIPGRDIPNMVIVALGEDGQVSFYTDQPMGGTVDLAIDVVGYFTADATGPEPV